MYRYIIFLPDVGYYVYPYYDFFNIKNVRVIKKKFDSSGNRIKCKNRIRNILECKILKMPSKNIWYDVENPEPDTNEELIFLFFGAYYLCSSKNREYIKKHYPKAKTVIMYNDLVKTHTPDPAKLQSVRDFADMIITYDRGDAKKYKFQFHHDAYSKVPYDKLISNDPETDIFFSGKGKDRTSLLLELYKVLKKNDLDPQFIIPGLTVDECINCPELSDQKLMSYYDYLKKAVRSNCLLEISQSGTEGSYSLRVWEAIAYNKKILTNNKSIMKEEFYDPKYIQVFDKIEDIDFEWIREKTEVNYNYADKISGNDFLEFISEYFNCEH